MPDATEIRGVQGLVDALAEIPVELRRTTLRNALAAGGRLVRDEARAEAPTLSPDVPVKGRKPGTVKNAIAVRTSKQAKAAGDVGVFVNVRPAKGGKRGAMSPDDPFYWQWLEFGRKAAPANGKKRAVGRIAPMQFLQKSATKFDAALGLVEASLRKQFEKLERKGKTP